MFLLNTILKRRNIIWTRCKFCLAFLAVCNISVSKLTSIDKGDCGKCELYCENWSWEKCTELIGKYIYKTFKWYKFFDLSQRTFQNKSFIWFRSKVTFTWAKWIKNPYNNSENDIEAFHFHKRDTSIRILPGGKGERLKVIFD